MGERKEMNPSQLKAYHVKKQLGTIHALHKLNEQVASGKIEKSEMDRRMNRLIKHQKESNPKFLYETRDMENKLYPIQNSQKRGMYKK